MRKKMLISIALILILLLNCIAPILRVAATTDSKIIFEKEMYAAIKKELERQGITAVYNDAQRTIIINEEEIAKVTSLSLSNCGLTDLTGLEIFTNLKTLDLSSNELNKDSNLEVLNSFELTSLDLSSNEIEDLSMVTNIKNIPKVNLHNQKFDVVEIIQVDTSESSDQKTTAIYPLPKILTEYVDYIQSEWLLEKNYLKDPLDYETDVTGWLAPYIDWRSFDHENLKVVYATKTATSYIVHKGMVKVSIKVNDSTNTLYNSDINLYFVIADSQERGIYIKDPNMYNAIKKQLTRGQRENEKLISYGTEPGSRHIYNRYFDEAQTLVISIDDIINKIPCLKLDNKRIKDITGIEKFVGLETKLDLSGNYIKSIDKLIELEKNQEVEEALLRQRVSDQIALVSKTLAEIDKLNAEIESLSKSIGDYNKNNADLDKQMREKEAELNNLKAKKEELEGEAGKITKLQEEIDLLEKGTEDDVGSIAYLNKQLRILQEGEYAADGSVTTKGLKNLNDELNKLHKDIADKTKEIADLEKERESSEQQRALNEAKENLENAKNRATALQVDIANKQAEITAKIEEISNIEERVSNITVTVATYQAEVAEVNLQIAQKRAEIATLLATGSTTAQAELNMFLTGDKNVDEGSYNYEADTIKKGALYILGDLQAKINTLNAEIGDAATGDTLLKKKNDLQKELNDLRVQLTTLQDEKAELEADESNPKSIKALEKKVRDAEAALAEATTSEGKKIKEEIEKLNAEIERIRNVDIPAKEAEINTKKDEIEQAKQKLDEANKTVAAKKAEIAELNKQLEEVNKNIAAKIEEIKKLAESMNQNSGKIAELDLKRQEAQRELSRQLGILRIRMNRLYTIYNRIDRLAGYATVAIRNMTDQEFYDLGFEASKAMYNAQVAKISTIEKYLVGFESNYLIQLYGIPTTITTEVEKKVVNPDGTTSTTKETETKQIENPISKYFSELPNDEWTLTDYKSWLYNFKTDDIYFAMYAHCYLTRLFEGKDKCLANEYADYIIERLELEGEDTSLYENAKEQYQTIYARYAGPDKCAGTVGDSLLYNYAKRITLASAEELNAYVYLPRLRVLDISENLIENIDKISELTKLLELYVGDNELVDISNVDWASINEHLKVLDLSLNDISNIEPLEVLSNIEYLDLSKNLIEGEFTFKVEKLNKLRHLDLSYNKIDDIQRLINYLAYEARARGYNGDIASYLRAGGMVMNFKYQQLEMTVERVLPIGDTEKVELPKIFRQIEEIDYANTSFGIDSIRGNVTSDGKEVILDTRVAGKHIAVVTIINTKTLSSFGYGTTCEITYRVGTANMLEVTVTPDDAKVEKGKTQQFEAAVTGENVPYEGVTWSIEGNTSEGTTISETGLLEVAENEGAEKIDVIATSFYDTSAVGKVSVEIVTPEVPEKPEDPAKPADPVKPEEPAKPEDPTKPADPQEPAKPEDPAKPAEPEKPADPAKPVESQKKELKLGYTVDTDTDYLTGVKAKTSVNDFKEILLNDNENYKVVVKASNKEVKTGYVATGMFAQVQDENGNVAKDSNGDLLVYEIIVKGDINGDGVADSLDTVLIKSHRSEVKTLRGAALKAADINSDNSIDFADSKLLLYHRAEVSGHSLNYTK